MESTSLTAPSHVARPSGVSAGPRKISVAVTVSSEPPNRAATFAVAVATSLSSEGNTVVGLRGDPGEPGTEPQGGGNKHEKRGDRLGRDQPTQSVENP